MADGGNQLSSQHPGEPVLSEITQAVESLRLGESINRKRMIDLLGRAAVLVSDFGEMAYTDHLTGLASSRYFADFVVPKLDMFCRGERRKSGPDTYMIGLADINGLKQANEEHGYAAGDELIKNTAQRIKEQLRAEDIVTRHGDRADEFIIVMPIDGIGEVFPKIATIISDRINSDGLSVALGFVSLDEYDNLDAALAAAQEHMMTHKSMLKQVRKTL